MKKLILALSCLTLLSCNDSKKESKEDLPKNVKVTGEISYNLLDSKIECDGKEYNFSIPIFTSGTDADAILNHEIKSLITRDFIDVTYENGTPLNELYGTFTRRRNRVICEENKNEGLLSTTTIFVSDTKNFTSYELEYSRANEKGRLLKTYLKPDFQEVHLSDFITEEKKKDVYTIFNANLQQAVALLAVEVPEGDLRERFIDYVRNTAFLFEPGNLETAGLAFQINSDISKNLRLSKKVNLPKEFDVLNNTVIIEIDAYQLTHYLDLSSIIK